MSRLDIIKELKARRLHEDAPANAAGGGAIAGIGVGQKGEPGVHKKRKDAIMGIVKRKKITVNPMPSMGGIT